MRKTTRYFKGYINFETKLYELEKSSGMTQEELSSSIFGSASVLAEIHRLKSFDPTLKELIAICLFFNLNYRELIPMYNSESKQPVHTNDEIIELLQNRIDRELLNMRGVSKKIRKVGQSALSVERIQNLLEGKDIMGERVSVIFDFSKAFKIPTIELIPVDALNPMIEKYSVHSLASVNQSKEADAKEDALSVPSEDEPMVEPMSEKVDEVISENVLDDVQTTDAVDFSNFETVIPSSTTVTRQPGITLSIKSNRFVLNEAFVKRFGIKPEDTFNISYNRKDNQILIDLEGKNFSLENTGQFLSSIDLIRLIIDTLQYKDVKPLRYTVNDESTTERFILLDSI